ncbi:hypothetical protein [Actinomadura macrotermitis]|uniref:Uncharacterized protein n=1 Tax=Actinomadura macrotermitis TaxID=2585200 RepID=A0A7K0C527_9ACTN|nr:hypothetical protein [Actinomadura macrotermitis]MQY07934.1 hypothetical protein [Actinomadura macrotermitis]
MTGENSPDDAQTTARTALLRAISRQAEEMAEDAGARDAASLANLAHAYAAIVSADGPSTMLALEREV